MSLLRVLASGRSAFFLLAVTLIALTLALPKLGHVYHDASVVSLSVLLAFTLELPLFFWLLVLRPRNASLVYAIPVAVVGYAFCRIFAPGHDSGWIASAWVVMAPLEVLLLAVIARRVQRLTRFARGLPRSADLIERLLTAADREFPRNRWVGALAYEVGVIHYALSGRTGIALGTGDVPFTYHRRTGIRVIYSLALILGSLEIVGVHLWLASSFPLAAWLLSGFEFYGVVWVAGLMRSVGRLPMVLSERGIHVRFGVIYTLLVPYENIERIERQRLHATAPARKNYLNCAFINSPDCVLKLREPQRAQLPYGFSRMVDEVGLMVDEPKQFLDLLERRCASVEARG